MPEYNVYLAKQQMQRYREFELKHPELDRVEARHAFYAQRHEINIAFTVIEWLDANHPDAYNPDHPVKP